MGLYGPTPDATTSRKGKILLAGDLGGTADAPLIGNNVIDSGNILWTTSGNIWWQEIGRTTLAVAGDTITVSSLPARKYLMILVSTLATGGTTNNRLRFGAGSVDTGNNYSKRDSSNGGADATATSAANVAITPNTAAQAGQAVVYVTNIAGQEKLFNYRGDRPGTAGAANAAERTEGLGKWANTASQIDTVSLLNDGTGDFAIGSEVVVLGHD